jgi:hypothetical protein
VNSKYLQNKKRIIYYIASGLVGSYVIYLSSIAIPIGSDPGRVWHFSNIFFKDGFSAAFTSLEPSLPVGLNASLMSLLGADFRLTMIQGLSTALIFALISNYVFKRYGLLESIIVLCIFLGSFAALERTSTLTPYPLYLLFLTLSLLLYLEYLDQRKDLLLYFSVIFIAASVYTFNLSITAIPIVFIHCVYSAFRSRRWKINLTILAKFYLPLILIVSPWFLWRFSSAGTNFYKNPIHWLGEKYWSKFNVILWKRPLPRSKEYFNFYYETGVSSTIMSPIMIVLGAIGALKVKHSSVFIIWILATVVPILLGKLPTEIRYLYAILPPLALLCGVSIGYILRSLKGGMRKTIGFSMAIILAISIVHNVQFVKAEQAYLKGVTNEVNSLKTTINPGEKIYFRSFQYSAILTQNEFIAPQYMEETDAIKLISWESEEAVDQILKNYEIKWMLLYKNGNEEERFNGWIKIANSNLTPKHFSAAKKSSLLSESQTTENFILYKVIENE